MLNVETVVNLNNLLRWKKISSGRLQGGGVAIVLPPMFKWELEQNESK
jgi:hypothetical protein